MTRVSCYDTGMRVCAVIAVFAILFGFGIGGGVAHANPKKEIDSKIKEAMENYDLMDYDQARKLLNQALAVAKKNKLDKDPRAAKAYLALGIVAFVDQDLDAAKLSFLSAVQIDPAIQIEPAYKSADMSRLLEGVRAEAAGGGSGGGSAGGGGPDCGAVSGLQHAIIDTAKAGAAQPIEALLASDVTATKVAVMYRPEGATDFIEVKLKKDGECRYTGAIPSAGMRGSLVHYYVAAFNELGKPIAARGSSGSPNIIELTGGSGGGGGGDTEDPIGAGGGGGGGGGVTSGVTVERKPARVMLAVSGGTGFGYVTGVTETMMSEVKTCCLGSSLVVLVPELGFFVTPQLSIGVAARIGLPLGANVEGHATAAPGGVARVRYALAPSGEGVRFMGQVGVGILRNTIKLDNSTPGMDTDIVAQGPLLIGGGVGFTKRLSGNVSFLADFSALAAIAIVDSFAGAPQLNSGFGADLSIGVQLGF
jgi:hypothetical protein